jgi:hypothetical protein
VTRARVLIALALLAIVGASAVAVVLAGGGRGDGGGPAQPTQGSPGIEARGALSPRIALFGDTIVARVDVVLDRRRVDPGSVRVLATFSPWTLVGDPERVRNDGGMTTHVETTFVLRCLTSPCIPPNDTTQLTLPPARVTYAGPEGRPATAGPLEIEWPTIVVHSRLDSADLEGRRPASSPWQADVLSLPSVSYRIPPVLALALLFLGAALLVGVGSLLAYLGWPRRAPAPPPPEPEPVPGLSPLEQALTLLESPAQENGAADRRRALELLGDALADRGDQKLARSARRLAWSEQVPDAEEASGLALRVRSALEEERDAPL